MAYVRLTQEDIDAFWNDPQNLEDTIIAAKEFHVPWKERGPRCLGEMLPVECERASAGQENCRSPMVPPASPHTPPKMRRLNADLANACADLANPSLVNWRTRLVKLAPPPAKLTTVHHVCAPGTQN